nr:hypothetical protein CFP56_44888 [Quercus suber]
MYFPLCTANHLTVSPRSSRLQLQSKPTTTATERPQHPKVEQPHLRVWLPFCQTEKGALAWRCLMKFLMSSRSHNTWRVVRRKIDCLQPCNVVDYKYSLHGLPVDFDEYLHVLYEGC